MLSNKEKKRLYDIEYRRKNKELIRTKKRIYNQTKKGRATQKRNRTKMGIAYHTNYCKKPEQKKKTQERDKIRRHGKYRECYELTEKIIEFVRNYYNKNSNGLNPKYARRKARDYYVNKNIC